MSKILADMLDKPEQTVAKAIDRLEAKAGYPSEDVRLIAASTQQVKAKVATLGLDPDDTTAEELYHALVSRFESDCDHLDKSLNIDFDTPLNERVKKAVKLAAHLTAGSECWSLKTSSVKNLLKMSSPRKLMKALSYRSVDSMLKRENPLALFMAARQTESTTWQKTIESKVRQLGSTDFEMRLVQLLDLSAWQNINAASPVLSSPEIGAAGLVGASDLNTYRTLVIALMLAESANSASVQHHRLSLRQVNPSLAWWVGAEHLLAWNDGQPVSLNIVDNALNHTENLAFADRTKAQAGQSLWDKLISGYKQHIEELPEELAEIDAHASAKLRKIVAPVSELAEEYVEA